MPTVRELLRTKPPSAIDARALVRAVVEHETWFVPVMSFEERETFGEIVLPPDGRVGAVPDELWLFSDREAVERAPQQVGFGTMSGIDVCSSLRPAWRQAQLDPGSPDALTMQLPGVVRAQLAQLARAVPLERELDRAGSGAAHALASHPMFFIALEDGLPLLMPIEEGHDVQGILVFTAADAVDGLFARLPAERAQKLQVTSFRGRELFQNVGRSQIGAVIVNPFGPRGHVVITGEALVELVGLVA